MYDKSRRVELNAPTVNDVIAYLKELPSDMKVYFAGIGSGYLHVDPERNFCSFDDSDLREDYGE